MKTLVSGKTLANATENEESDRGGGIRAVDRDFGPYCGLANCPIPRPDVRNQTLTFGMRDPYSGDAYVRAQLSNQLCNHFSPVSVRMTRLTEVGTLPWQLPTTLFADRDEPLAST